MKYIFPLSRFKSLKGNIKTQKSTKNIIKKSKKCLTNKIIYVIIFKS